MVQILPEDPSKNQWGRVGRSFANSLNTNLSEQLPKKYQQERLAQGLHDFEKNSQDLTPMQQLTKLYSIPGITPQMAQSFGELARQQTKGQALKEIANASRKTTGAQNPYKTDKVVVQGGPEKEEEAPSLTTRTPIEATLNPYIPKSFSQLQQRVGEFLNDPKTNALYGGDPNLAMQAAVQEDAQEQAINSALQGQRTNESAVQNVVQNSLRAQQKDLGAEVPGNVFSEIENKAINAVKPKSEGGEGLTEQQAIKKYGKELDAVSRDYKALETVGSFKIFSNNSADGNKQTLRSIQEKFKERDDLENLADSYISKNKLSPSKAYYLAYPLKDSKELNNSMVKVPDLKNPRKIDYSKGYPNITNEMGQEEVAAKTIKVAENIAQHLGKEGSPLAVAEELQARGYDPYVWMDYLTNNRKKLNLSERQGRELDKPRNFNPSINDLWLFTQSGLDKLVEQ